MTKRLLLLPTAAAVVLGASAWAGTIGGTPKDDRLKGTPKADKLYGRAGNDKLYGLAGNDLLVGGPGADFLSCGAGRDTALADLEDNVARDCELVKGIPKPPSPPAPPPPAPPPPSPPAPPAPTAAPGRYCGFNNQGHSVCLDVTADGKAIANIRTGSIVECQPAAGFIVTVTIPGPIPLKADLSFSYTTGFGTAGKTYVIDGKLDTAGNASGTLHVPQYSLDYEGTHFDCANAPFGWSAKRGA